MGRVPQLWKENGDFLHDARSVTATTLNLQVAEGDHEENNQLEFPEPSGSRSPIRVLIRINIHPYTYLHITYIYVCMYICMYIAVVIA